MKCFSAYWILYSPKETDNGPGNCQTSTVRTAHVSGNKTEPVTHAGKGVGYHQKYPLHDPKCKALQHLCSVPATFR